MHGGQLQPWQTTSHNRNQLATGRSCHLHCSSLGCPWKPSSTSISFPAVCIKLSRSQQLLFSADKPTCPSHTRSKRVTSKLVIHSLLRFIAFSTDLGPVLGLAHHSSNAGWPSHITAILQQVWPAQRYIEFDRHITH